MDVRKVFVGGHLAKSLLPGVRRTLFQAGRLGCELSAGTLAVTESRAGCLLWKQPQAEGG